MDFRGTTCRSLGPLEDRHSGVSELGKRHEKGGIPAAAMSQRFDIATVAGAVRM